MLCLDLKNVSVAEAVSAVVDVLRVPGGVAVVPTETVYGVISRVTPEGSERIYALKHRSGSKKLGWFVGDWRILERYGVVLTSRVRNLAERFMPGAITVIVPIDAGGSIGFRVPDHPFLSALLAEIGEPLLQTSANLSGAPDSLTLADALAGLDGEVDAAVNGGPLPPGSLASTVVDARTENLAVLRQGALKLDLCDL
jgi:L-threonylcarbamoyladenylate synthase